MVRIACVGIAVQDRLYRLNQLPKGGGKHVALGYQEVGGGPAATAAVAAARLGAEVDYIGRVGDDATGATILADLKREGVNVDHARICKNARSSHSAVFVDSNGERMIVNNPSPDLPVDADWLESVDFGRYDLVLADVRWHQGSAEALAAARRKNVPTMLDADMTPQDISELVQRASHAVFSAPGLQKMTCEPDFDKALRAAAKVTDGHVYVTRGEQGCNWLESDALRHLPGFSVKVVDTTGAGDVFHGALAVALAERQPLAQAIRFANAVAALKCSKPGGRAGIPNRDETLAFLAHAP